MSLHEGIPSLWEIAEQFDNADRYGANEDSPEGACYIILSDTLTRRVASLLRSYGSPS